MNAKKFDIGDYYSDFSLIAKSLGWKPQISLVEGMKRTLNYYRERLDEYL